MLSERPHVRTDGIYVSRNTYFRLGAVHWDVKNPVHLVVYYRYFRFFADGQLLTRTSPETLQRVWHSMQSMPRELGRQDSRLRGRWQLKVRFAFARKLYDLHTQQTWLTCMYMFVMERTMFTAANVSSVFKMVHLQCRVPHCVYDASMSA